jgi:nitrogen fixation/metabolism regulation signal transduction histidine kinase
LLLYNESAEELPKLIYTQRSGFSFLHWVSFLSGTAKTGKVAQFMENLFLYAINISLLLIIIASILFGLYLLYKHFYANCSSDYETKEFISPFVKATKVKKVNPFINKIIPFGFTNNDKIRAMYIKKIKSYINCGLKIKNNTSTEISHTTKLSMHKDISELTHYYEKARYSNDETSKEDLIKINKLTRKHL